MENLPTNLLMASSPLQQVSTINSSLRAGWGQRRNTKRAKEIQQKHHGHAVPRQTGTPVLPIFEFLTALIHLAITFIPASINTSVGYSILDRTVRFVRMRTIRKCTQMDVRT